jgi:Ran GTPase-activating protein (RanGAP) involved in mRNA processing and transport
MVATYQDELEGVIEDTEIVVTISYPVMGHAELLMSALRYNTTLEVLTLAEVGLSDGGVEALSEILLNHRNAICRLDLDFVCWVGERGMSALVKVIKNTSQIDELSLSFIAQQKGVERVLQALEYNSSITKFTFHDTQTEGTAAPIALGLALVENSALTTLILKRNDWGDEGAAAIASVLLYSDSLTRLVIETDGITDIGFRVIAGSLINNTALTNLELDGNAIEEIPGSEDLLSNNSTLSILSLNSNQIDDVGAEALSTGLCMNTGLKYLHLNRNDISFEGMEYLADALSQENSTLLHLELQGNDGGSSGACSFANCLRSNTTLKTLDLSLNKSITDLGAEELMRAMKSNSSLQALLIEECGIDDELTLAIDLCTLNNREAEREKLMGDVATPEIVGRSLLEDMQKEAEKSSTKDLTAKHKRKEAQMLARIAGLVKQAELQEKEIKELREKLRGKAEVVVDLQRDIKVKRATIHLLQTALPDTKRRRTRSRS